MRDDTRAKLAWAATVQPVVICAAKRTPIGSFQGSLSKISATDLGSVAIGALSASVGFDPSAVDEVVFGCVLAAGLGQAPARQASIGAGLSDSIPATTINKMCGSGMKAVMLAHDRLALGHADMAIAGGMESMTNAPYLIPKLRSGARLGHVGAADHMFLDGLEDAYEKGRLMGTFAEDCASSFKFSREDQDDYSVRSLQRALQAQRSGAFAAEIEDVIDRRNGEVVLSVDEQPQFADPERVRMLKPAFRPDGTVTAANSSSISDGAAALLIATEEFAESNGLPTRARIVGHATAAGKPALFTTAPALAAKKLLQLVDWSAADVGLWEVNEAFAVVAMAFARLVQVPQDRINVNGGACSLGHPIGASGARILVTLLHAMEANDIKRGVAAICIGGGEATALAVERP